VCGKQTLPLFILGKSRMRKRARTDLCGGRSAMVVPTATIITRPPCWDLRSAPPNEMTPWLGLQLEGLHYAQTGVIEQD
jgi:hypothetical protein